MRQKSDPHYRRSLRLRDYDYSLTGAYFVTVCTQVRVSLFGEIFGGQMRLNDAGRMIERWWSELGHKFPTVQTDGFVVMPNHVHGIIVLGSETVVADLRVGPSAHGSNPTDTQPGAHIGAPLPSIVQWFKTMTTNDYIRGVKATSWPTFNGKLWQRNYYEHVIRNEVSLARMAVHRRQPRSLGIRP